MPPPIEIPKKKLTVLLSDIDVKFTPSKVEPQVYIQLERILYTLRRGTKDIYEDFGLDQLVQYLMSTETNLLFRQFFQQVQAPQQNPKYLPPMTGLSSASPLKNFRALRDIESAIKALRKLNGSIIHGNGVNVGTQVSGMIKLDGFEAGDVGKTVTVTATSWNQTRFNAPQAKTNKVRNFRLDGNLVTLKKMRKSTPHPLSGVPVAHPDTAMMGG